MCYDSSKFLQRPQLIKILVFFATLQDFEREKSDFSWKMRHKIPRTIIELLNSIFGFLFTLKSLFNPS